MDRFDRTTSHLLPLGDYNPLKTITTSWVWSIKTNYYVAWHGNYKGILTQKYNKITLIACYQALHLRDILRSYAPAVESLPAGYTLL